MYFSKKEITLLSAPEMSIKINTKNWPLNVEKWK